MRDETFDRPRLIEAFGHLGADLAARAAFLELAVYGGSALMLQFSWRRGTEDVEAVVRPGSHERLLAPSVARVAAIMGLPGDWLNGAVGMFTPLDEPDGSFQATGVFPAVGTPGLRVMVAKPHYLLAMKLLALRSADRGDRDLTDARALAREVGIGDEDGLSRLYASIHREPPAADLLVQFRAVFG